MSRSRYSDFAEWKCHKEVRAARIIQVADQVRLAGAGKTVLDLVVEHADGRHVQTWVEMAVVSRYFPKAGDYVVVYEDEHVSISPRKAFEDGYTRQ
jgi:hypothetical protein